MYAVDPPGYPLYSTYSTYASIPVMYAHTKAGTFAIFWRNASETYVDIKDNGYGKETWWLSDAGELDFFLVFGKNL